MHLRWLFNVRNSLQVLHARLKMNAAVSPQENLLISNLLRIPRTKTKQTNTFFITLRWEAQNNIQEKKEVDIKASDFQTFFSCKRAKIESDIYILGVKRRRIILTRSMHLKLKAYTSCPNTLLEESCVDLSAKTRHTVFNHAIKSSIPEIFMIMVVFVYKQNMFFILKSISEYQKKNKESGCFKKMFPLFQIIM